MEALATKAFVAASRTSILSGFRSTNKVTMVVVEEIVRVVVDPI
jgi:hypothetical protein